MYIERMPIYLERQRSEEWAAMCTTAMGREALHYRWSQCMLACMDEPPILYINALRGNNIRAELNLG